MVGVSRGTVVVMVLGVLLGIEDGVFNGVFHVKRGGLLEFIYLLCFTWNMGNACEGNLLRLRSCFEACFMGWVWRIRINECWIGRGFVI